MGLLLAAGLLGLALLGHVGTPDANAAVAGRLVLFSVPPVLTADNSTASIYVQLQTLKNRVALASSEVLVRLSSSNPQVADVVGSITIPPGESGGFSEVRSAVPGRAVISATAEGYEAARALNIVSSDPVGFPTKLKVFGAPADLPVDVESRGTVVVQLQDSRGSPARAADEVEVTLASSDT